MDNMRCRAYRFVFIICVMLAMGNRVRSESDVRFAILSDIHVFDNSLIVSEGEAFEGYLANDRKMLKESGAIVMEVVRRVIEERPDYVLVSGDLTKDGELLCHRFVADSVLGSLLANGIQPIVVPGNHDINNPNADIFDGGMKRRTTTIQPEDFARIYADYGYRDAVARDTASLSYVYAINDSLRVLALDACRYEDNDFEKDFCVWHGRLKDATVRFAVEQLRYAKEHNIRVIGLMHHGLIEHWKYQNMMLPGYVVEDYAKVSKLFAKNGLRVIFTGHAHSHDASMKRWGRSRMTDIQTGSTVSYPVPYRTAVLRGDSLCVATHHVKSIANRELTEYSAALLRQIVTSMIKGMLPASIDVETRERATEMLANYFVRYTYGDEKMNETDRREIKEMARRIRRDSLKWSIVFREASKALLSDSAPTDNTLTVKI